MSKLTEKDIVNAVSKIFIKYDLDEDGFLSRAELKNLIN